MSVQMATDFSPRSGGNAWDRRVSEGENLGRRRADSEESKEAAETLAQLCVAVRIGVTVALAAAIGATIIAWWTSLLSAPAAMLVIVAVTVPWAIAYRLASGPSRRPLDSQVDLRIRLP
jgi:hypothetical protein